MTDEQKVKEKWPRAYACRWERGLLWTIMDGLCALSDPKLTSDGAWASAALRLAPAPESHKESNDE